MIVQLYETSLKSCLVNKWGVVGSTWNSVRKLKSKNLQFKFQGADRAAHLQLIELFLDIEFSLRKVLIRCSLPDTVLTACLYCFYIDRLYIFVQLLKLRNASWLCRTLACYINKKLKFSLIFAEDSLAHPIVL